MSPCPGRRGEARHCASSNRLGPKSEGNRAPRPTDLKGFKTLMNMYGSIPLRGGMLEGFQSGPRWVLLQRHSVRFHPALYPPCEEGETLTTQDAKERWSFIQMPKMPDWEKGLPCDLKRGKGIYKRTGPKDGGRMIVVWKLQEMLVMIASRS